MPFKVLYQDEDLLALDKPAGLPTQATVDKNRPNFYNLAQDQYGPDLYLHHRLDKDTSGVMIFSKSKKMNPLLAALFQDHRIQKTYWALVSSQGKMIPDNETIESFLELQKKSKPQKMKSVSRGGKKAITYVRKLKSSDLITQLECQPRTGRTHQIRVHLSERGYPILGDSLYGGQDSRVPRLMLHAYQLDFCHPVSGSDLSIQCAPPADFKTILDKIKS